MTQKSVDPCFALILLKFTPNVMIRDSIDCLFYEMNKKMKEAKPMKQ